MIKLSALLVALCVLSGCVDRIGDVSERIDAYSFETLGGTLFSDPDQVTMKEVHLDNSLLIGRQVVVEGAVLEVGKFFTFAIMSDDTARMLVVLTDVDVSEVLKERSTPARFKVLGEIASGKKGLPYIQARAVKKLAAQG